AKIFPWRTFQQRPALTITVAVHDGCAEARPLMKTARAHVPGQVPHGVNLRHRPAGTYAINVWNNLKADIAWPCRRSRRHPCSPSNEGGNHVRVPQVRIRTSAEASVEQGKGRRREATAPAETRLVDPHTSTAGRPAP